MSKLFRIVLDGVEHDVEVEELGSGAASPAAPKAAAPAPKAAPKAAAPTAPPQGGGASAGAEVVAAPLQGTVLTVEVTAGQSVKKGENLVVISAMKMENEIVAPRDCVVKAVLVNEGANVAAGDALLEIG